jgi:ferredoxin
MLRTTSTLRSISRRIQNVGVQCPTVSASSSLRWHGVSAAADAPAISITFIQPDGSHKSVYARVGESLLQTAHRNDIDLEGACEGVCACSTCHLILPASLYDQLPEASEDEEDMLDMAFGLTETSRLGCQIVVTADMEGMELEMPKATRNFYVDGHVPKPH